MAELDAKNVLLAAGPNFSLKFFPSLERFIVPRFPVRQIRQDCYSTCLNLKTQIRAVIEHDADSAAVIRGMRFNAVNDLAFELSERSGTPFVSLLGRFTLAVSHCRLSSFAACECRDDLLEHAVDPGPRLVNFGHYPVQFRVFVHY